MLMSFTKLGYEITSLATKSLLVSFHTFLHEWQQHAKTIFEILPKNIWLNKLKKRRAQILGFAVVSK